MCSELTPDYDLDVMRANQTLGDVMAHILVRIQPVLREFRRIGYLFRATPNRPRSSYCSRI